MPLYDPEEVMQERSDVELHQQLARRALELRRKMLVQAAGKGQGYLG